MFSIVGAAFDRTRAEHKKEVMEELNSRLRKPVCRALEQWLRKCLLDTLPPELRQQYAGPLQAHLDELVPVRPLPSYLHWHVRLSRWLRTITVRLEA